MKKLINNLRKIRMERKRVPLKQIQKMYGNLAYICCLLSPTCYKQFIRNWDMAIDLGNKLQDLRVNSPTTLPI